MQITIDIFDNDYRSWSGSETLEFDTVDDAYKYAREKSWSGYSYIVDRTSIPKEKEEWKPSYPNYF